MRKLHTRPNRLGLLTLAVSIGTTVSAQTTFQSSNNPSACLRVERVNEQATLLHVTQSRKSINYVPLSQNTVLRDPQTGMSYPLRALDVEIVPSDETEHMTLKFAPFLNGVGDFELINPSSPNQSLYFKGIRKANIEPGSLADLDGSTGI